MLIFEQQAPTLISRRDPRLRVAAAFALAFVVVLCQHWTALLLALAAALLLMLFARGYTTTAFRRCVQLNFFVLFIFIFVPLSMPGDRHFSIGPLTGSYDGVAFAARVALKANVGLLLCIALLGKMEPATLAHALQRLGMPDKLAQTLFFCIRYLEVCHLEYHRLRNAMKLRGFEARCSLHCLRDLGNLLGMLFLRSMDRSDRVLEAMKCRGFAGRLFSLAHFQFSRQDWLFTALLASLGTTLVWIEWGL